MKTTSNPLPPHRQNVTGRTFSAPWDAGTVGPGAAIQRHDDGRTRERRRADRAFGVAMLLIVLAVLYVGARGWLFGGVAP